MITSFIQEELSVFDFIIGFQFYFPQILHTMGLKWRYVELKLSIKMHPHGYILQLEVPFSFMITGKVVMSCSSSYGNLE